MKACGCMAGDHGSKCLTGCREATPDRHEWDVREAEPRDQVLIAPAAPRCCRGRSSQRAHKGAALCVMLQPDTQIPPAAGACLWWLHAVEARGAALHADAELRLAGAHSSALGVRRTSSRLLGVGPWPGMMHCYGNVWPGLKRCKIQVVRAEWSRAGTYYKAC